jgi:hypothetical protein
VEHLCQVVGPGERFRVIVAQILPIAVHDTLDEELGLEEVAPVL